MGEIIAPIYATCHQKSASFSERVVEALYKPKPHTATSQQKDARTLLGSFFGPLQNISNPLNRLEKKTNKEENANRFIIKISYPRRQTKSNGENHPIFTP